MALYKDKLELTDSVVIVNPSVRSDGVIFSQGGVLKYNNGTSTTVIGGVGPSGVVELNDLSDVVVVNGGGVNLLTVNGTLMNLKLGKNTLSVVSTGTGNIAIGQNCLNNMTTANNNLAIGDSSLNTTTSGSNNTCIGNLTGSVLGVYSNNTYISYASGELAVSGNFNTHIGKSSGRVNVGDENTSVGESTLIKNVGTRNTAIGRHAGAEVTSGNDNIYIGVESGNDVAFSTLSNQFVVSISSSTQLLRGNLLSQNLTIGQDIPAEADFKTATKSLMLFSGSSPNADADVGSLILFNDSGTLKYRAQTGGEVILNGSVAYLIQNTNNTGLGIDNLNAILAGTRNTVFGYQCMLVASSANDCCAFGYTSLSSLTIGSRNTTYGSLTGLSLTSENDNTLIGYSSGKVLTSSGSTFVGSGTGEFMSTGSNNSLFGYYSGRTMTVGNNNAFFGYYAGQSFTTGSDNVAIGYYALSTSTTETGLVSVGFESGKINASSNNTYIGYQSGFSNTSGDNSTLVGYQSGRSLSSGIRNTNIGSLSGYALTTGHRNFLGGYSAGLGLTSGNKNVLIGHLSGSALTTQNSNVFIGESAGTVSTTSGSTLIGAESGLALTSGVNNVFLGKGSGGVCTSGNSNILIGYNCANTTGFESVNSQFILANNATNQLIRGDLVAQNIAFSWNSPNDPDFKSSSGTIMLSDATPPIADADATRLILYSLSGNMYIRAQDGQKRLETTKIFSNTYTVAGTYTIATIPRALYNTVFSRYTIKNTISTANLECGRHSITWRSDGADTTTQLTTFGQATVGAVSGASFSVVNDGVTNVTIRLVVSSFQWNLTYVIEDSI